MSPRRFNYFDDRWKTEVLECPKCHWLGTFEQGSVAHYMDQMDCACPKCEVSKSPTLAVVVYPTLPELRANMGKPGVREWVEQIDRGFDEFEAQKLREASQLPDIGESSFELVWDFDDSNPNDPRTLIKHGNVVVFSEPARFEEFKRFGEVCAILKARYGERMKDLVPTLRSEGWLYGNAREANCGSFREGVMKSRSNEVARVVRNNRYESWHAIWSDKDGSHSRKLGDYRSLPTRQDAINRALELGIRINLNSRPIPTVNNLLDGYKRERMPDRFSTQYSMGQWITNHIVPKWGRKLITDVQPRDVELWLRALPLTPKSQVHIRSILSQLWDYAMWSASQSMALLARGSGQGSFRQCTL